MMELRADLPRPIPAAIERLPRDRGYPVPWFVAWLKDGKPAQRGVGAPDFRVLFPDAIMTAYQQATCWICGERLVGTAAYAFVIGPMCAVNRVSAEPPSHLACADWAARACPFLAKPHMVRRAHDRPDGAEDPAGIALMRNPGVALVWISRNASLKPAPGGVLFDVGDPIKTRWYREGRPATRVEIMESITTGLPTLQQYADEEGPDARAQLDAYVEEALELLPA